VLLRNPQAVGWLKIVWVGADLLVFLSVTAYLALNFTGSTTFTSRSGVKNEIFAYVPAMAWMFGIGCVLMIVLSLIKV
jgi:hypothetical protein